MILTSGKAYIPERATKLTGKQSDNRKYPAIRNTNKISTECLLKLQLNYEENTTRCQIKTSDKLKSN